MTIASFITLLIAIFKFPAELSAFIKLLEKSPEEKKQEIMTQVDSWMNESASKDDGRPTWEHP